MAQDFGGELSSLKPRVSIVIVYWKGAEYLSRCLSALSQQTYRDFELILINNGAERDPSMPLPAGYLGINVRLERFQENRGFAAANNFGARLARGHWLALLNSDAFPRADWLERLVVTAEENPAFCSFASRQLRADAPDLLDGAGDVYHVSGMAWRRYQNCSADTHGLVSGQVFSACGAAALYRRETFLQMGGFDEDFFSYLEDVDLGFRLRLRGYLCLYVADAVVEHVGSQTSRLLRGNGLYYWHRNLLWAFVQNMPSQLLWPALPLHLMWSALYQTYHLFQGYGPILWRAQVDALHGLPRALNKRTRIQRQNVVRTADLLSMMQVGFLDPLLKDLRVSPDKVDT